MKNQDNLFTAYDLIENQDMDEAKVCKMLFNTKVTDDGKIDCTVETNDKSGSNIVTPSCVLVFVLLLYSLLS